MQAEENLDFWLEVEKFKKIKSHKKRISEASRIISVYVEEFSPKQVNLTRRQVNRIMDDFHQPHVESTIFDEAQDHVNKLLMSNCVL